MTKTEIIRKGTRYFHDAIQLGEKAYDDFMDLEGWLLDVRGGDGVASWRLSLLTGAVSFLLRRDERPSFLLLERRDSEGIVASISIHFEDFQTECTGCEQQQRRIGLNPPHLLQWILNGAATGATCRKCRIGPKKWPMNSPTVPSLLLPITHSSGH